MRRIFSIALVISIIALVHSCETCGKGKAVRVLNASEANSTVGDVNLTDSVEAAIGLMRDSSMSADAENNVKSEELKNVSSNIYYDLVNKLLSAIEWAREKHGSASEKLNDTKTNLTDSLADIMTLWKDDQGRLPHESLFDDIMKALQHVQKPAFSNRSDSDYLEEMANDAD